MTFYFSAYSTPLLFGFVQGWVYAILLWVRGVKEERLSDKLLSGLLIGLCFDIWIYMLGFGGIEIFWKELEFFPRTLGFLVPPLVFFYLKSQFDTTFRFRLRDARHALPFVVDTVYHVLIWAMGPAVVQHWETTVHNPYLGMPLFVLGTVQQFLYLYWSLQLYRAYRAWTKTQFSDTDTISFRWFRNFLLALTVTLVFGLLMTLLDIWLDLDYWQDWWGNLVGVLLIYYVSIEGYAQMQPARQLRFRQADAMTPILPAAADEMVAAVDQSDGLVSEDNGQRTPESTRPAVQLPDLPKQLSGLLNYMDTEKPYFDPDLSLADLARRLHTVPALLSQVINVGTGKNFNDFINEYRVEEFKRQVCKPANAHLSFLGLALDCGFNSKATFNRAFKKFTGLSPKEFVES